MKAVEGIVYQGVGTVSKGRRVLLVKRTYGEWRAWPTSGRSWRACRPSRGSWEHGGG